MKQIELFASNHETNNEAAAFAEYVGEVNNAINVDITVTCTVVDNYSETTGERGDKLANEVSAIIWTGYCDEDAAAACANAVVAWVASDIITTPTAEPETWQQRVYQGDALRVDPATCTLVDVARALVEDLPEMADPDEPLSGAEAVEVLCSVWPGLLAALERESPRITRSLVHPDLDGRVLALSNGCFVAQHPDRGDVVTSDIVAALAELSAEPQSVRDSGGRFVHVAPVEEVEKWADSVDADIGRVYP